MDSKANYFIVGLFVIIFSVAIILASLWLSFGFSSTQYQEYLIDMNESVAGLSIDAPVKFNGVNVGSVESISLNPNDPQQVEIKIKVAVDTPVNIETKATLMSQGLTGISYVNLSGGTKQSPLLKAKRGKLATIPASPSLMLRLDTTVKEMVKALNEISADFKELFNAHNQKAISDTLNNLAQTTSAVTSHKKAIQQSVQELPELLNSMQNTSEALTNVMMSLNTQTLPQADAALSSLQGTLPNLAAFSQNVASNPSVLLRGQQPVPLGPGE